MRIAFVSIMVSGLFILLGCYPLTTSKNEWKIKDDPTAIQKKQAYLNQIKQDPDK